jgi:hypothetical protein
MDFGGDYSEVDGLEGAASGVDLAVACHFSFLLLFGFPVVHMFW